MPYYPQTNRPTPLRDRIAAAGGPPPAPARRLSLLDRLVALVLR